MEPSRGVAFETAFVSTTSATAPGVIVTEACWLPVRSGVVDDCDSVAVLMMEPSPVATCTVIVKVALARSASDPTAQVTVGSPSTTASVAVPVLVALEA